MSSKQVQHTVKLTPAVHDKLVVMQGKTGGLAKAQCVNLAVTEWLEKKEK